MEDVPPLCTDLPTQLKLLSGLFGCLPFYWHYAALLTSFSGHCKRLPNLVNVSWFSRISRGFEPSRNVEMYWINDNWAYLRKILFRSFLSNGRIPPDKNTNALSSPGIISSIELPSANVTSLFSRSCITSCLRWAGQQIRNKMFGVSRRK